MPTSYLEHVIDECDIVRDRRISYDEFIALWNEEDDKVYTENLKSSYSRRSSKVSNSSFDEDNTLSQPSDDDYSTDMSSVGGVTGTAVFKERKHLSVRGGWV